MSFILYYTLYSTYVNNFFKKTAKKFLQF